MPGLGLQNLGVAGGAQNRPYWLWYESFNTDDAAPVAASAAANPGPGTTHFTGSTGSISSGRYNEDVGAASAGPYQNTGYARTLGLACVAYGLNPSRLTSLIDVGFAASAGFGASSMRPGFQAGAASATHIDGTTAQTAYGTTPITTGAEYDICVLADATGGFSFWKPSSSATWTLAGLSRFDTTATIFARCRWFNAAGYLKALGLAAAVPMPTRYPFAASGVQGQQTPAASFMAGLRLTSTATNGLRFRRVDGSNHFRAERTNGGALRIVRVDAGVDTVVSTSAMTAAANDRLYLRLEGNTVRISGHPTGGTWVNPAGATITQHSGSTAIEVLDESVYDSLEVYPLTGHNLALPLAA